VALANAHREDPLHLAAGLRNRGADRVGHLEVRRPDDTSRQPVVAYDHRPAADQHDRQRVGRGTQPGDAGRDALGERGEHAGGGAGVHLADQGGVAELDAAGHRGEVGHGQRVSAKDACAPGELVADAVGTYGGPGGGLRRTLVVGGWDDNAAAADVVRVQMRHAEVCADPGDRHLAGCLAGEPADDHPDVGGRTADVDDYAVGHPGQERGATQ
jgi:hypothetical protein